MDIIFDHLLALTILVLSSTCLYILVKSRNKVNDATSSPPEPPGALPIVGHLLQLGSNKPIFRTMADMAAKHGPIFTLRFGSHRAIVVSSYEAVKECFTRNDVAFASRPRSSHGIHLGYDFAAFGFAPYGPYWRTVKRLVMTELLSARPHDLLKQVYVHEVENLVKSLYEISCKSVVISEWIEHFTLNIITDMIAGKKYFGGGDDEALRIGKVIKDYMLVSGALVISDFIPVPKWVDLNGNLKVMKRVGKEIDVLIQGWIEEHKNRSTSELSEKQDFIDVMLSVTEDNSELGYSRDTIIKGTISNLIIAGSDTTAINLAWALALLLNNKQALKRAQDELDALVGKQRWVEDSDIKNLVYLQAIVKETLRLYPPGPLAVPHEACEDIQVCGYDVPKGTRLFVNVWKLHRDPSTWPDPEVFLPERFLTSHSGVDASGKHFEFIPFGSGRRSCPGMSFALHVTHFALARILQGFELALPLSSSSVDMSEGLGITLPRATPLEVVITPRLHSDLYQ